ncbi:hypothetical protein D9V37_12150 [Nocardioides mangrovicus]|uniref:Polysaccharide chain length determinant N-terminal domain-containing protein n=1 Tax=Nocardioides mangrovicus TaxID=2478913 RepID=A0A3L8P1G2_9ACTN|nr:hypothetical protein [Nocardioides mangrovicus]RLV49290.1 hypothetical protein D9V37_12150 [Nocardioides mangrovicus]
MSAQAQPAPDRRRTPVEALLRWWPLALVAAILGGAIGFYAAEVGPVTYTAEARVAVGAGDLTSGAIAGFPLAAEQLASNYARYVNDQMLTGDDAAVAATPIPESNVIRIIATSDSSATARSSAQQAADKLIKAVNESSSTSGKSLLDSYQVAVSSLTRAQQSLTAAQAKLDQLTAAQASAAAIRAARARVVKATQTASIEEVRKDALASKYQSSVTSSTSSKLVMVQKAVTSSSDRSSRLQRYALLGVVSGAVVALLAANLLERLRRPRKRLRSA